MRRKKAIRITPKPIAQAGLNAAHLKVQTGQIFDGYVQGK
jgi:hypothetical protein